MPISSNKVMIEAEGVGKRYWVGGHQLIDTMGMHALLERGIKAPIRLIAKNIFNTAPARSAIWANCFRMEGFRSFVPWEAMRFSLTRKNLLPIFHPRSFPVWP